MKLTKKLLTLPVIGAIGLGSTLTFANNKVECKIDNSYIELYEERISMVSKVTGKVIEISKHVNEEETFYYLLIRTGKERDYIVYVEEGTLFIKDGEIISIGNIEKYMEVTVHFKGYGIVSGPIILDLNENDLKALKRDEDINILKEAPVRVNASVIVINTGENSTDVTVDIFDEYLISSDHSVRLEIFEDTVILDKNNEVYEGSLENKKLAIISVASTASLPSIPINPKIIVLGELETEEAVHPDNILNLIAIYPLNTIY